MKVRLPGVADGLAGVVFKIWKQRFFYLFDCIKRRGLLADWRQEGYAIAWELAQAGWRYGDRRLPNEIYNRWYKFLVQYGFRKRKRDGVVEEREFKLSEFGEEFFEKVKEIVTEPDKKKPKKKQVRWLKWRPEEGDKEHVFTAHFLKRWGERVDLEFSPKAVYQQLTYGGKIRIQKSGPDWIKARVKCPWFTLVVCEHRNKRVLITVLT